MNIDSNFDTISDLKFIGRINRGEKMLARYRTVQPDTLMTKMVRTFYFHEGRDHTLNFIRKTIMECLNIIALNKNSDKEYDCEMVRNIIADLRKSLNGINNIKDTYSDDTSFCCALETIEQQIKARLQELAPLSPISD